MPSEIASPRENEGFFRRALRRLFSLRSELPLWVAVICGLACMGFCYWLWSYVTSGEPEERIYGPLVLPSPSETFKKLPQLWTDGHLLANTWVSLRRVLLGFGLAVVVGVPIGVACGCFSWVNAFFMPLSVFGRNVPMAALIFLTFALFGSTTEKQKYMFIFLATVAFIVSDSARAIQSVGSQYVDTAYTLGANRWQVIAKVLFPLALPEIFNSCRLLFGLAFGYIMLAEVVTTGSEAGGLGHIINLAQSRGSNRPYIILILILIPAVALGIDRILFWIQRQLFPYRYGGWGLLQKAATLCLRTWEDVKRFFWHYDVADEFAPPRRAQRPAQ